MIRRKIESIIKTKLFNNKVIVICGARQVGKTTLLKMIAERYREESIFLNCDEPDIRSLLSEPTSTKLKELVGNKKIVFIDEAQRVKNIGITLKLFVDQISECQVIATGSSALGILDEIKEPLTGRKYEFQMNSFSYQELAEEFGNLETKRLIEERIIYGMYPEIVLCKDDKKELLKNLASSYLFKDILSYKDIRKPEILEKLLTALALQIGNQVSYNEIASMLKIDNETVTKYIELLEKTFVIFRLMPFSRNLRTELTKTRKIYFYDTGIRNALISNFQPLSIRQDTGALWENFLISERIKFNMNNNLFHKTYFWRTKQQQEIDFIEELDGQIIGYEIKWGMHKRFVIPKTFLNSYPESKVTCINKDNFEQLII